MRMLHVGLRVEDLQRSLEYYANLGYETVGTVPDTAFGTLTMLKLPGDEFVSLELVHRADEGPVDPGGLNHLVVQTDDLHAAVTRLADVGIEAEEPSCPPARRTSGLPGSPIPTATGSSSSSGLRGHADGMTRADFS